MHIALSFKICTQKEEKRIGRPLGAYTEPSCTSEQVHPINHLTAHEERALRKEFPVPGFLFGVVQRVAALVFFAHAVNYEHH